MEENKEATAKREKAIFLARAAGFILFAAIMPFCFIAWRFGIFSNKENLSLSGWGIIGIVVVSIVLVYVLRQVGKTVPHTMTGQCINGFLHVILPLGVLLLMLEGVKTRIQYFEQMIMVIILCEVIAIPINPFPKWIHDHMVTEKLNIASETQKSFFSALAAWWKVKDE